MALPLPYPSLDFVPLDVLTAEEQNEIVSNYSYIASEATPRVNVNTNAVNITSAGVTVCSLTGLTAGQYFVIGNISHGHGNANNSDYARTKIAVNGTEKIMAEGYLNTYWNSTNVTAMGTVTINSTSDTLTLIGSTANNNTDTTAGTSALVAIRMS